VHPKTPLLDLIHALRTAARLTRSLHCGQKQGNQNANDGDHHQQFNECKASSIPAHGNL
jgi:hypothetical protein